MSARHFSCTVLFFSVVLLSPRGTEAQPTSVPVLFAPTAPTTLQATQQHRLADVRSRAYVAALHLVLVEHTPLRDDPALQITLPTGRNFTADRVEAEPIYGSAYTWIGKPRPRHAPEDVVSLIVTDRGITGSITFEGERFFIRPLGAGYSMIFKVKDSEILSDHPKDEYRKLVEAAHSRKSDSRKSEATVTSPQPQSVGDEDFDIMVVYTPAAEAATSDIEGLILQSISDANQIYGNSGIGAIDMNPVHMMEVNYSEGATLTDDRNALRYGQIAGVNDARDYYGADVVVMIVDREDGACGLATAILASANEAFAVAQHECLAPRYTLAHEVGHLIGAEHELGDDLDQNNPVSYNHGLHIASLNVETLMGQKTQGATPRIPYLSTPAKTYSGVALGTTQWENNTRMHAENASRVADFRPHYTPLTINMSGPYCVDYGYNATFYANASGGDGSYTYTWQQYVFCNGTISPFGNDDRNSGVQPRALCGVWISRSTSSPSTTYYNNTESYKMRVKVTDGRGESSGYTLAHHVAVEPMCYNGAEIAASIDSNASATADSAASFFGHTAIPTSAAAAPENRHGQVSLLGNVPNPFTERTRLDFELSTQQHVRVIVHDVLGRHVATLVDRELAVGSHHVVFDGSNLPDGIYLYLVYGRHLPKTGKMVLAR